MVSSSSSSTTDDARIKSTPEIDEWIKLNMGVEWKPGVFFSDFELAIRSAILRYFDGWFFLVS
jgi:hypothetical protein